MKILSLNTWGGRAGKEKILDFLKNYNNKIDIFCLQEIWSGPYEPVKGLLIGGKEYITDEIMVYGLKEISELMPDYIPYFKPQHLENYGVMILVHKNLKFENEGEIFVHKHKGYLPIGDLGYHARNLQFVSIREDGGKIINVLNFHGLWNGLGKGDSEDRFSQSEKIISFIKTLEGEVVLCGDFNLSPETKSLKMIEREANLKNLIKENNITSTRTSYYTKPEKFADYTFVSKGLEVLNFQVLPDEVSDHSPMLLEIK